MSRFEPRIIFGKDTKRMSIENFNFPICVWYSNATEEYGIDMNPEYQRGLVWDIEHKVKLIDSIVEGIGVPSIFLRELEGVNEKYHYEMVDGKQRLSTIVGFMQDEFPYNGKVWSEHDAFSHRVFEQSPIGASVLRYASDEEVKELYNRINFGGVPHDHF